jgi:hypothetical protein
MLVSPSHFCGEFRYVHIFRPILPSVNAVLHGPNLLTIKYWMKNEAMVSDGSCFFIVPTS